MRQSKKWYRLANLKSWCFYSWSKGTPLTSVLFAINLLVLLLTSCAAHSLFYTRWTALQDQAASLKSTIDINSARKVLSSPIFEPRQELVMSVVTRMKESTRRTTKARMMYKNRARGQRWHARNPWTRRPWWPCCTQRKPTGRQNWVHIIIKNASLITSDIL